MTQNACYRLLAIHWIRGPDIAFLVDLIRSACFPSPSLREHMASLREARKAGTELSGSRLLPLMRTVFLLTRVATVWLQVVVSAIASVWLLFNLLSNDSLFVRTCWLFWWTQDLIMMRVAYTDYVFFPAAWLLVVLEHRIRLSDVRRRIERLTMRGVHDAREAEDLITRTLPQLLLHADRVNDTCAPVLFLLTLFTTPVVCLSLFLSLFAVDPLIRLLLPAFGIMVAACAALFLATAAHVSSTAERRALWATGRVGEAQAGCLC